MTLTSGICTMVKCFLSPLGYLPIGRLLGRSEIKRELYQYILIKTFLGFFSLGSPLVQEMWSSIAQYLFLSISFGTSIGQSWAWSGDLGFSCDFDQEIVRATGGSTGRPWRIRVWLVSSWFRLLGTLSVEGSLRQLEVQSGYQNLDKSGFLWDLNLLGYLLEDRSEDRGRQWLVIGGPAFRVQSGYCSNTNRHNCWI